MRRVESGFRWPRRCWTSTRLQSSAISMEAWLCGGRGGLGGDVRGWRGWRLVGASRGRFSCDPNLFAAGEHERVRVRLFASALELLGEAVEELFGMSMARLESGV